MPTELKARLGSLQLARPDARIRATVIGASQYTMQVSGRTIFVSPLGHVAAAQRAGDRAQRCRSTTRSTRHALAAAIKAALKRLDLGAGESPVAVFVPWRGSATFRRLDNFCKGIAAGT